MDIFISRLNELLTEGNGIFSLKTWGNFPHFPRKPEEITALSVFFTVFFRKLCITTQYVQTLRGPPCPAGMVLVSLWLSEALIMANDCEGAGTDRRQSYVCSADDLFPFRTLVYVCTFNQTMPSTEVVMFITDMGQSGNADKNIG